MNEEGEFYTLGQVAHLLSVQPYRITYQLITGKVPEPKLRLGGKRIFCVADIKRLAEHLQLPPPITAAATDGGAT